MRLGRRIACWPLVPLLVACAHSAERSEPAPSQQAAEIEKAAKVPARDGERKPMTTRDEVERELATPSDSGGGTINFPGADLVARRGDAAVPTVLEIVRDLHGACATAIRSRLADDGRRCFVRLAAFDGLSRLCRNATAERIVPALVAVASDTDEHDKERSFAIAALASAEAPSAMDALGPLFLALHSKRDPLQDRVLSALAQAQTPRSRKLLDQLASTGDQSTRQRVQEALDDLNVVRY